MNITQITEEQAREMLGQTCISTKFFEDGIREWERCGYIKKSAMEEYQEFKNEWPNIDKALLKNGYMVDAVLAGKIIFEVVDRLIEELRSDK